MTYTREMFEALQQENEALRIKVGFLEAAAMTGETDERREACHLLIRAQDRWLENVNAWMKDTVSGLRGRINRQRKELKRLNRAVQYRRQGFDDLKQQLVLTGDFHK